MNRHDRFVIQLAAYMLMLALTYIFVKYVVKIDYEFYLNLIGIISIPLLFGMALILYLLIKEKYTKTVVIEVGYKDVTPQIETKYLIDMSTTPREEPRKTTINTNINTKNEQKESREVEKYEVNEERTQYFLEESIRILHQNNVCYYKPDLRTKTTDSLRLLFADTFNASSVYDVTFSEIETVLLKSGLYKKGEIQVPIFRSMEYPKMQPTGNVIYNIALYEQQMQTYTNLTK